MNCVFLDASAAYDNVHYDILMSRHGALDPPGRLTRWINSFLHGGIVDTKWGSTVSKKRSTHRGVRQRSSISPILWILHTAPMVDDLRLPDLAKHNTDIMPFKNADDVAMAVSSKIAQSSQDAIQGLLCHVLSFCRNSCITLNASKSAQIVISSSYRCRALALPRSLNNTCIPQVTSCELSSMPQ